MRLVMACISLLVLTVGAQAQLFSAHRTFPTKVAIAGKPMIAWEAASLNPDCSSRGPVIFTIIKPPAHGTAVARATMIFPNYPPGNPRSICNTRKDMGTRMTYTSEPGYSGRDDVDFEAVGPDGRASRIHVAIVVQ